MVAARPARNDVGGVDACRAMGLRFPFRLDRAVRDGCGDGSAGTWCWAFGPSIFTCRRSRAATETCRLRCEMKVNVIEPLGNDMDVYMSTNLHDQVVGRVEAQPGLAGGRAGDVVRRPAEGPLFRARRDRDEPEPETTPTTSLPMHLHKHAWTGSFVAAGTAVAHPAGRSPDERVSVALHRFVRNCGPPVRWLFCLARVWLWPVVSG